MALKPTIFKFNVSLSDLNRERYQNVHLTVAQHPSETTERMMARILAYCINAEENLSFTKGLSDVDEPDIWLHTLDNQIALWIDIGEPSFERLKKASRQSLNTKLYCFNSKADVWWEQSRAKINQLPISVVQFDWDNIQSLTTLVGRTMNGSLTITGSSAYVALENGECEVNWKSLSNY